MKYLSNKKRGKNTRKIYRVNKYNYDSRYSNRYKKILAIYAVFSFDLSEGWRVYCDYKLPIYKAPSYKEYYKYKYYNKNVCGWIEKFK